MITYYAHSLCKHPAAFITPGHTETHWDTLGHFGHLGGTQTGYLSPGWCGVSSQLPPVINNKMENVDQCCLRSPLLARPTRATDGMINAQLWRTSVGVLPRRGEHRHCEGLSLSQSPSVSQCAEDGSQQGGSREDKANFKTEMIFMMMNQKTR